MESFNFETLKKEIYYKLFYPEEILATRKDATEILQLSNYYLGKLRKKNLFPEFQAKGFVFFYKEDLLDFRINIIKESYKSSVPSKQSEDVNYDDLIDRIWYKLCYPEDKLFTRKTGPTYLSMTKRTFDDLRKNGEFTEYEYLGVKFFNKEEIKMWKEKRKSHLKIISKPEYYTTKVKK